MSTGTFENWAGNISDIGVIYPFEGGEAVMVIACVVFWLVWHVLQMKNEQAHLEELSARMTTDRLREVVGHEDPENP